MKFNTICVTAISILLASGCGPSQKDVHREAILRILNYDKQISKNRDAKASVDQSNTNLAKVIDEYCVELEKQDMTECPPEFRLAFNRHIESWRTTAVTIRQIPGMMDAFLAGMLSAVTGDDATSGGAGDLKKAEQEIRKTYEEVERIAAKYEVAL
ncbi:MAG: hypothetical protein JNL96_10310 [Planctomycetaceae bacterium]|nr:hypothetical protein [Planctomycetaceae bacterium]